MNDAPNAPACFLDAPLSSLLLPGQQRTPETQINPRGPASVTTRRQTFQCAVVSLTMAVAMIIAGAVIMTRADYGGSKAGLVDEYNRGAPRHIKSEMNH